MQVWTPAFQHRFLDGNPANFNGPPGVLTVLPDATIRPTPPPGERGFAVGPGRALSYQLERPFHQVIGLDLHLDVVLLGSAQDQLDVQVHLDGQTVRLIATFIGDLLRLQLWIAGVPLSASIPIVFANRSFRLHARWHTHGQAWLWVDGLLKAYHPALQPGASLTVGTVFLGHHFTAGTIRPPEMRARRFTLKVLRREDGARFLDSLLPLPQPLPVDPECAKRVQGSTGAVLAEARALMAAAIGTWTHGWSVGDPGMPFSADAIAAHEAAVDAGRAFAAFMHAHQPVDAARFLGQARLFLARLQAVDPVRYAALVAQAAQATDELELPCVATLEPIRRAFESRLAPIAELARDLDTIARNPGGANA